MKRGLVLTLCVLALGAFARDAAAQSIVDVSLNLRYTDPANPAEGGKFYVVAQSNATMGIAGLSLMINNIDQASAVFGVAAAENGYAAVTRATLGDNIAPAGNSPFKGTFGGAVNLVYGQDLVTTITNVGKGAGTPGNIATDPLRNTATWNNAALLFSGTFGATRPTFAAGSDANVFTGATTVADATVTTTVRGDSMKTLGLESPAGAGLIPGDANRDGIVNVAGDGFTLVGNLGVGTTWGQGDFNNSGSVNVAGDGFILVGNLGAPFTPPAVGAVPEPATAALALAGAFGLISLARRRVA